MKFLTSRNNFILFFVVLMGASIRIYNANLENYWFDEQISFYVANPNFNFYETLSNSQSLDRSPFLFNLLLKYWFKIFGYTPEIGRYFSVFLSTLSLITLLFFNSTFRDKNTSFLILFLIAFNIFLIDYSGETRSYSLVYLLSLINIFLFIKIFILKQNNHYYKILFFLISILCLLSQPFTILIKISEICYLLIKDFKRKNFLLSSYFTFLVIFLLYIGIEKNYLISLILYSPPESFIRNPELNFFFTYFFDVYFGSKVMGLVFLSIFIYLVIKNKNLFIINSLYLYLLILIFLTYLIPVSMGYIFKPSLQVKYIIFIITPLTILISCLLFEIKNKNLKKYILIVIIFSTLGNLYFEFKDRELKKPDFKKILQIDNKKFKNFGLITIDTIRTNMVDVYQEDPFKEQEILKNYVLKLKKLNKETNFYYQDTIPKNTKHIFLICYQPVAEFKCEENIRIKNKFKIIEKYSSYQVDGYFLRRYSNLNK